jgi:2-polyprenyl-3-methyl-5-hydroxy-6-metoxy-1,4-benzoquinol methylase
MQYKVLVESATPSPQSQQLIKHATEKIALDMNSLCDWYTDYAHNHHKRLSYDIDYVLKYIREGSKVIEFGSIPLILTLALSSMEYEVLGTDIQPERFQVAIDSHGLIINKVDIETTKLPFHDDKFDGALFNEVFEHLRIHPIKTLQQVYRVIKPGGVLLLSTPNLTSLSGWFNLIVKNKAPGDIYSEYEKLEKLGHMGHVREYTPVEICSLLEKIGFQIMEVIYRGSYAEVSWKGHIIRYMLAIVPRLRPFFSVVARKPVAAVR